MYRSPEFIVLIMLGDEHPGNGSGEEDTGKGTDSQSRTSKSIQPRALQPVNGKARIDGVFRWIEEAGLMGELSLEFAKQLSKTFSD